MAEDPCDECGGPLNVFETKVKLSNAPRRGNSANSGTTYLVVQCPNPECSVDKLEIPLDG